MRATIELTKQICKILGIKRKKLECRQCEYGDLPRCSYSGDAPSDKKCNFRFSQQTINDIYDLIVSYKKQQD